MRLKGEEAASHDRRCRAAPGRCFCGQKVHPSPHRRPERFFLHLAKQGVSSRRIRSGIITARGRRAEFGDDARC